MSESTEPSGSNTPLVFPPPQSAGYAIVRDVFFGPNGLRALVRLLVFFSIIFILFEAKSTIGQMIRHGRPAADTVTPSRILLGELSAFLLLLIASWLMSLMEGRRIADYGLPWKKAFGCRFWQGIAVGFAAISALLVSLWATGTFHFGAIGLHGGAIWTYAAVWVAVFLCVGFFEEFLFRGYTLFTLTTGIGFWPAAVICSALFGYVHYNNTGETSVGAFSAGAIGLVLCFLLRRTGDLWMAIGVHAGWDWGESYFYGVPDSGQVMPGHLFNPSLSGPVWLTGGSVGPEGSWLCLLLMLLLWLIFARWLRETKYPNREAIPDPRRPSAVEINPI